MKRPGDRLADLAAEIAVLKAEHDAIEQQIITGEIWPVGVEWAATVDERQHVSLCPIATKPARAAKWHGYRRRTRKVRLGK